ncbi:MAG: glycosyltransferase family 2 protein [Desulfovibrio sp.]|nr:glycosyltransferase family 2 protein [Desulfovibrio sp.]
MSPSMNGCSGPLDSPTASSRAPLVSVIIPAYNYAHFLGDAVESVLLQRKDGIDVDIVIVDDGSTDDTPNVIRGFGDAVRSIRQVNQGLAAARNTGIAAARGDFLLFLDADDMLTRGTLAGQLSNFRQHPELDISVCLSLQTSLEGASAPAWLWPLKRAHLDLHLCYGIISPVHSFLVRASAVHSVGFFDTDLGVCEDNDYWQRCAARGLHFGSTTESLVLYRRHGGSMTGAMADHEIVRNGEIRRRVAALLERVPGFPRAGKYLGWLAYVAKALHGAPERFSHAPASGATILKDISDAVQCLLGVPQTLERDAYLGACEQYFAVTAQMGGLRLAKGLPSAARPVLRVFAQLYPRIAALPDDALQERRKNLEARLCCEEEKMRATVAARYRPC